MSKFSPQPELSEADRKKLADVCLSIATNVISTYGKDKNLVLAPLSLLVLMEMKKAVSKHLQESSKVAEIASYAFADASQLGGPRLSCSNGVWIEQSFNLEPECQEILQTVFKAACERVDFKNEAEIVRKMVNEWVEKKTNGLIKDLLERGSVDCHTKMIYANAVYFKGIWKQKFDKSLTEDEHFFLQNGTKVKAPFMKGCRRNRCAQHFDQSFKVLSLSYEGPDFRQDMRDFSMCIFLPDERDALPSLLKRMESEPDFLDRHIPSKIAMLRTLRIPKFEIDFSFKFSSESLAIVLKHGGENDLIKVSSSDEIVQKAFIKVDEQGTEAAAASRSALCCARSAPLVTETFDFVADHPFLFVIRMKRVVLFVGQVLNPLN